MIVKPNLLVIGYVWPEPKSSAAGTRMLQLLELFGQMGYALHFATPAAPSEFQANLEALSIQAHAILLNDSSFDQFVIELQPQVVVFDRFMMEEQFGWRVDLHCPNAIKILETVDLHFLRKARIQALKLGSALGPDLLQSDDAKREIASIFRCDLSLIISEFEMELLQNTFKVPAALLHYIPILHQPETTELPAFEMRKDFIFIGNFLHQPNWQAVKDLKEKIWPILHAQLPEASMLIYGAYPSEKVFNLHNAKQKFLVMGRADEVETVMRSARVCLAPLQVGAGIKGKILDAMRMGTPFVATDVAAEGMVDKEYACENTDQFVSQAIKLYTQKDSWQAAQQIGFDALVKHFAWQKFSGPFIDAIQFINNNKEVHRRKNFIGAILKHQSVAATKYMSLWIEEKNKKPKD